MSELIEIDDFEDEVEDFVPNPRHYNCERYEYCYTQAAKADTDIDCGNCMFYNGQIISHPPTIPTFSDSDIRI